jgi:hypothetical protein
VEPYSRVTVIVHGSKIGCLLLFNNNAVETLRTEKKEIQQVRSRILISNGGKEIEMNN